MTNSVQALLVEVPQPSTSDRSLEEVKNAIPTSSVALEASEESNPTVAYEEKKLLKVGLNTCRDQTLLLPLQQPEGESDVDARRPSSLQNDESISGRCNPEPIAASSAYAPTVLGMPTSPGKNRDSTANTLPTLRQETENNDKVNPSGSGGEPAREALAVKVIRPFPVKTVPQVPEDITVPIDVTAEDAIQHQTELLRTEQEQTVSTGRDDERVQVTRGKESQSQKKVNKRLNTSQCDFPSYPGTQQAPQTGNGGTLDYMVPINQDDPQSRVPHIQYPNTGNQHHTVGEHGYHQQQRRPPQPFLQATANLTATSGTPGGLKQPHSRNMSVSGSNIEMDGGTPSAAPPTPLFERLVSEEVQEIKTLARIIESQNRRIEDLERVHDDLEQRLELLAKERVQLEATLEDRERNWSSKFAEVEKVRDEWKQVVQVEQRKNDRLRNQLGQKDKDIHRMLARKYDHQRDPHNLSHSHRNYKPSLHHGERSITPPASASGPKASSSPGALDQHKSPHDLLTASGSIEAVRERNVAHSLLDFFGM